MTAAITIEPQNEAQDSFENSTPVTTEFVTSESVTAKDEKQWFELQHIEQEHIEQEYIEQQWHNVLQSFCNDINTLPQEERLQWLQSLGSYVEEKLEKHPPFQRKTLALIIRFSGLLCDWPLQILAIQQLSSAQSFNIEQLSYAYWKIGDWQGAFELLKRHMLLSPSDNNIYQCYRTLNEMSEDQDTASYQILKFLNVLH